MIVLLAGGVTWGIMASQPGRPAWQPATIDNLVLEEGPDSITTGTDYHPIGTRAEDPAPLTTAELAKVFAPRQGGGPMAVSPDCAGAVTGALIIQALKAAGCSQEWLPPAGSIVWLTIPLARSTAGAATCVPHWGEAESMLTVAWIFADGRACTNRSETASYARKVPHRGARNPPHTNAGPLQPPRHRHAPSRRHRQHLSMGGGASS